MPNLFEELRAALADRYAIERELGHGGMAYVFLAQDLKHHRPVAIKVLRPELAQALGADRFLREIEIVARLTHPHILALYDSGEARGLLYYVMPYVEGESLRDRLTREQQLPVDEAVEIARQVASALTHAHSHDVVHRDIKPENILLAGDEVVVADFGIARAITVAGGEQLTSTGIAVGTAAYMSPEQGAGETHLDGRSDVYSLGCVLYEMLTGAPPFAGPTAQAIQARRMMDPVPPLHTVRGTVPAHVEQAILKALAKVPADRFAKASQFADALIPSRGPPSPDRERGPGGEVRRRRGVVLTVAALILALVVWAATHWSGRPSVPLDANVVAVFPFRVTGADSTLGEGMVDLLAAKLTGEGGPRAASPQSVISAWRRAVRSEGAEPSQQSMLRLARGLGAGKLLLGSLVGTPGRWIISASLLAAPNGREEARARVEGPADSLLGLVDLLASRLLIAGAGVTPSLASLTSTSLPALQAYLEGRAAYRRGRWDAAAGALDRAVTLDSTFALAALALEETSGWGGGSCSGNDRCIRLAWQSRGKLAAPDRAMLAAYTGPGYPNPSPEADILAARENLVRVAPDRPEAWYLLGDHLFHWGEFLGVEDSRRRASAAFQHALELDSRAYVEPLLHLVAMSAEDGDTAAVRRYGERALAADSLGEAAQGIRWIVARELRDSAAVATIRAQMETMSQQALFDVLAAEMDYGGASEDAARALTVLEARASTARSRMVVGWEDGLIAYNAGRPARGATAIELTDPVYPRLPERWVVLAALYWDGVQGGAAQAVKRLAVHADALLAPEPTERDLQYLDICTLEQWRIWRGQMETAPRAIKQLRSASSFGDVETGLVTHVCAPMLEAMLAVVQRRPSARGLLERLDSLMKTGPPAFTIRLGDQVPLHSANLVIAKLWELEGNLARALAASRRRSVPWALSPPTFLTTYLREEGRLAALAGDTAGAIRAYSKYLQFRSDPDPALKPEVDRVRAELARLVGEKR